MMMRLNNNKNNNRVSILRLSRLVIDGELMEITPANYLYSASERKRAVSKVNVFLNYICYCINPVLNYAEAWFL